MLFETETGSVYELRGNRVRRIESTHGLRRDGDWLRFTNSPCPVVGQSLVLHLEPLAENAVVTIRRTSHVTRIEV